MTKINDYNLLKFPLIDEAKAIENSLFTMDKSFEVPNYIHENLIHSLREYQQAAIRYFHYSQSKTIPSQQVLFNMSTGSGKTDLMAALILYLYKEKKLQNFLFTVNTKSVLMKTRENLINQKSDKYLFKDKIEIDGEQIFIKEVDYFNKNPQKNTIYIKLSSIQKLTDNLFTVKEGMMGIEDYKKHPIVVLYDEAHHGSASTKSRKEKEKTWEQTLDKIRNARNNEERKNIHLEFTATVDFKKNVIYNKYKDKVVFRYPLSKFMNDGFSKQVKRIETSANDSEKMLNVILLSQFRKYQAALAGVTSTFKPVIMFKSSKVEISKEANKLFNEIVANLNSMKLIDFIKRQQLINSSQSSALGIAYEYYLKNENNINSIIRDIKHDFDPKNIINANDNKDGMLDNYYDKLNSLENPNNHFRVVFAVAKLTEGWDVLNLFDIVRIEKEAGTNQASTMVEAQLIGRGARYYPFEINGYRDFKRRFDNDPSNNSLFLETLHYHTINEPQYLKQLVNSLKQMDLPTGKDLKNPPIEVKVKSKFKETDTYKNAKIYYNETEIVEDNYFDRLSKYGINHKKDLKLKLFVSQREVNYKDISFDSNTRELYITNFDDRFIKKAIQKIEFYKFNNLKKYIPTIKSMNEFIYGEKWLNANNINIYLEVPKNFTTKDVKRNDILNVIVDLMKDYEIKIKSGYVKKRGTNRFIGYPIKEYLSNYKKRIPEISNERLFISQDVKAYDMTGDDYEFYVYEKAIVNNLEISLIERIKGHVKELTQKYNKSVYLFRMDEQMHRESVKSDKLKLHQYGNLSRRDGENTDVYLQGFQPDFILFLESEEFYFQIFIEPKGMSGDRYEREKWKEDLLLYLTDHYTEIEFEDEREDVIISGLKFYTQNDSRKAIPQLMNMVFDDDYETMENEYRLPLYIEDVNSNFKK